MTDELLVWVAPIGAWLVTYVIHSAILFALAYLIARRLESRRPQLGDTAWKLALIGALVTASVQVGTGISPVAGALSPATAEVAESTTGPLLESSWSIAPIAEPIESAGAPVIARRPATGVERRAAPAPMPMPLPSQPELDLSEPPRIAGANLAPVRTEIVVVERAPAWLAAVIAAWLAGALLFGGALLWSWMKLRWMLRRRQPIKGQAAELLDRVAWRAGLRQPIRLSEVEGLDVPIAFGILEPEIALPARAQTLEPDQLETLLAHECAHLVRRDPGWRLLGAAIRSVFWVQPLNRLVCRRLESCSELCADDWAVAHTDRPLELARCLTEVARWLSPRGLGSTVPAMARPGSVLGTRVRRLVDSPDRGRGQSRWFGVAAIAVVACIAFAAPGASNAAATVDTMLPTAAVASSDQASEARRFEQVKLADRDAELAAAAVRKLVAESTDEVELDALLEKLDSGQLDSTLNQWLKGPGEDWEFDLDFDFDFDITLDGDDGDDDDDDGDDDDDDGDDDDGDDGGSELLDPRDFIEDFNNRWRHKHDRNDNDNDNVNDNVNDNDIVIELEGEGDDSCDEPHGKGDWKVRAKIHRDARRDAARRAARAARRANRDHERAERHRMRAQQRAERHRAHARERAERLRRRFERDRHQAERHHREVFREAIELQRRAIKEAMKARGQALESTEKARESVERAMREAERALREAEQIRQKLGDHHRGDVDVDVLIAPDPDDDDDDD